MTSREKCRTCGQKLAPEAQKKSPWYPFCGDRCRLIDLGQWFDEDYRLGRENLPPEKAPGGESSGK